MSTTPEQLGGAADEVGVARRLPGPAHEIAGWAAFPGHQGRLQHPHQVQVDRVRRHRDLGARRIGKAPLRLPPVAQEGVTGGDPEDGVMPTCSRADGEQQGGVQTGADPVGEHVAGVADFLAVAPAGGRLGVEDLPVVHGGEDGADDLVDPFRRGVGDGQRAAAGHLLQDLGGLGDQRGAEPGGWAGRRRPASPARARGLPGSRSTGARPAPGSGGGAAGGHAVDAHVDHDLGADLLLDSLTGSPGSSRSAAASMTTGWPASSRSTGCCQGRLSMVPNASTTRACTSRPSAGAHRRRDTVGADAAATPSVAPRGTTASVAPLETTKRCRNGSPLCAIAWFATGAAQHLDGQLGRHPAHPNVRRGHRRVARLRRRG